MGFKVLLYVLGISMTLFLRNRNRSKQDGRKESFEQSTDQLSKFN